MQALKKEHYGLQSHYRHGIKKKEKKKKKYKSE
jgi:hypothetical protein